MSREKILIKECKGVYAPREDSYLLAEATGKHARGKTLDMGCGSGIQGITAAKNGSDVTFADISEAALSCAEENCGANGIKGTFILTDLFAKVSGKFDTIIFNPPYVPTAALKRLKKNDPTTDGGVMGREVIKRFLADYRKFLAAGGKVLMLESSHNLYGSDMKKLAAEIVGRHKEFFEALVVLSFS
jgi:release factor glutamine methyltransferase